MSSSTIVAIPKASSHLSYNIWFGAAACRNIPGRLWLIITCILSLLRPIGVSGGISTYLSGRYGSRANRKLLLFSGQLLMATSIVLFALAGSPDKYWNYIFPGMIVGTLGIGIGFVGVNVAVMASAPQGAEGVVGALVNTAIQVGATIGLATMTTITIRVNGSLPADSPVSGQFKAYQNAFWSLLCPGSHRSYDVVAEHFQISESGII